ncbi:SDR family oxidoreductase [Kineococcus xinjiangensis]|uniref:SDR family oxidoreductase n=1 Tax=Kineococcus xinjiangensis TaxID=512762 RepID=UPI000CEBAA91|nr:SDR family oxidoreductase [Kineococcus xinjiangensis]
MRLADELDGKRLFLTGVTGFVGEALLQRLLVDLPGTRVVALVRPKPGQSGEERMRKLLRKPIFSGLDAEEVLAKRLEVFEADLDDVPELPGDLDVVVHCAGDVSFDPVIQEAFSTNVHGTERLVQRVLEANGRTTSQIHYVHVSTAYVGGRRRGAIPERAVEHTVDWRVEAAAGERVAARIEDLSRTEEHLVRFLREAEREHGHAGPLTAAADAERRRGEWVVEQQKAAGKERARTLGWTDVYTFTKAMGERVVEELAAPRIPTSIVRPSIIESALKHPHPGWIEGFKMAEPIILAYGRGEMPEFPAAPDSVLDVVPIDHVVNAILKVCATPPPPSRPGYFHVASGSRNPATFRTFYEHIREHFRQHPFEGAPAELPVWNFPGADRIERKLVRGELAIKVADRALSLAPRSDRARETARKLDKQRRQLEFLRRYMDLYQVYTQAELRFVDDNTLALHRSLDPADVDAWGFDTAVIDWREYVEDIHCPSVTAQMRKYDEIRRRRKENESAAAPRQLKPVAEGDAPVLAVFDLAGTLKPGTVVDTYLQLRLSQLDAADRVREFSRIMRRVPRWIAAERRDRGSFLRSLFRGYDGVDLDELEEYVDEVVGPQLLKQISSEALRRISAHREAGHRTILMTGDVRQITRPLTGLFDEVVCTELEERIDSGRRLATGFLTSPPLVGESRAAWLRRYAELQGADLGASHAYADSHSDLPLLRAVGSPTAVSPDVPLFRAARAARWPVADWAAEASTSRLRLPQRILAGRD